MRQKSGSLVIFGLQQLHAATLAHEAHEEVERLVPEVAWHGGFLDPLRVHVPIDASFLHIDHHLKHIFARLQEWQRLIIPLPVGAEIALLVGETAPVGYAASLVYIATHPLIPSLLCREADGHLVIPSSVVVHHDGYTPYAQRDFFATDCLDSDLFLIKANDPIAREAEVPGVWRSPVKCEQNRQGLHFIILLVDNLLPQDHPSYCLQMYIGHFLQPTYHFPDVSTFDWSRLQHLIQKGLQIWMSDCRQDGSRGIVFVNAWLQTESLLGKVANASSVEHFQKNDSQRPYIRSRRCQSPRKKLRGHIVIGPFGFPEPQAAAEGRRQHVSNNQLSLLEQDVVGFEISMDHSEPVQPLHALRNLPHLQKRRVHLFSHQQMLPQIAFRTVVTDYGEAAIVYLHNFSESQERVSLLWIASLVQVVVKYADIIHQLRLVDSGQGLNDFDGYGKVVYGRAVP